MSIKSVQKSTQQIEGGGREGAAGHEVESDDGEDNPGITLEREVGEQRGIREPVRGPSPSRSSRGRRQHSPIRLGTKRKIFSLGIAAFHLPPRTSSGGANAVPAPPARPHPPARHIGRLSCALDPAACARPQMLKIATGGSMGQPDVLWAQGARATRPSDGQSLASAHPVGAADPAEIPAAPAVLGFRKPTLLCSSLQNWRSEKGGRSFKKWLRPL